MKQLLLPIMILASQHAYCMQGETEKTVHEEENSVNPVYADMDLLLNRILVARGMLEKIDKQCMQNKAHLHPLMVAYAEYNHQIIEKFLDAASKEKERAKTFLCSDLKRAHEHVFVSQGYTTSAQLLIKKYKKEIMRELRGAAQKRKNENGNIQASL